MEIFKLIIIKSLMVLSDYVFWTLLILLVWAAIVAITYFLIEVVGRSILKQIKMFDLFVSFIWRRKEFYKWLKKNEDDKL